MIKINLYDYKTIIRDEGIKKRVVMVGTSSLIVLAICLMVGGFQLLVNRNAGINLAEVEAKVVDATPDYKAVQQLKKQQEQYTKIITGIDQLRSDQARTTEFLEDIGQAVPEGIWLTSIRQMGMTEIKNKKVPFLFIAYDKKTAKRKRRRGGQQKDDTGDKFIGLYGVGMDDQQVVHFLDQLRAIPYVDAVVLNSSRREWMENEPVQKFDIYLHFLNTKPAA